MIKKEYENDYKAVISKDDKDESWGNLSDESLINRFNLKKPIKRIQFYDNKHGNAYIGTEIHIFF